LLGVLAVSMGKDKRNVIFIRGKSLDRCSECQRARKIEEEKFRRKRRAHLSSAYRSSGLTALRIDSAFLMVNGIISNCLIPQITIPSAVIIIRYEAFHVWNVACMLPA